jgi:hypothetical protein
VFRSSLATAVALSLAAPFAAGQDRGRTPPQKGFISVTNNTPTEVKVYLSSVRSVTFAVLKPGEAVRFSVLSDNASRILTSFDTRTNQLIDSHEITVALDNEYDVAFAAVGGPEPVAPGGGTGEAISGTTPGGGGAGRPAPGTPGGKGPGRPKDSGRKPAGAAAARGTVQPTELKP